VSNLPKTQELIQAIRASDLVLPREGAIAITALETAARMHTAATLQGCMDVPEMRAWIGGHWLTAQVWAGVVGGSERWLAVSSELLPMT
jgi:hypothetical protein